MHDSKCFIQREVNEVKFSSFSISLLGYAFPRMMSECHIYTMLSLKVDLWTS